MGINLFVGLAATLLAALQVAGWIGLGSFAFRRANGYVFPAPAAAVAGASVTGGLSAVLCWLGLIHIAILTTAVLSLACLIIRRDVVVEEIRSFAAEWSAVSAKYPGVRWVVGATVLVAWILAIAPPRDADVLRYHLAHIRQILRDGAWLPIPDYHYALPFGWSINYLLFESLHLPEAAQTLSLLMFGLAIVSVFHVVRRLSGDPIALWTSAVLVYQPLLLKAATTASADAFMLLTVAATVGLLLADEPLTPALTAGLGFMAWIGLQSRYQAAAIGLAVTLAWLLGVARGRQVFRPWSFMRGVVMACALSAPFYVFNVLTFRNPFWPVFVGLFTPVSGYAGTVASWYTVRLGGTRALSTVGTGIYRALWSPEAFPVPWLCALAPFAAWKRRSVAAEQLLVIVFGYLIVWAVMQPSLYPRFFLYIAPPTLILISMLAVDFHSLFSRVGWTGKAIAWSPVLVMMTVCLAYSEDAMIYFVGRDVPRYHRFTWYYEPEIWVNAHTNPDDRLLVVLNSAQTYYFDRPYRRADPCFSAEVDWPSIHTPNALATRLHEGGFQYLVYGVQDWSGCPGGSELMSVVEASRASGLLREVKFFDVQLSTLRILRKFQDTRVVVYQVDRE